MAKYIPPHKRNSKDSQHVPSLPPFRPHKPKNHNQRFKPVSISYADDSIRRWFAIPCNDKDAQLSCSVRFQEFSCVYFESRGWNPMVLACDAHTHKDVNEIINISIAKTPWISMADKIRHDLFTSFQNAKYGMLMEGPEIKLPHLVVRFGKVLFHGISSSISPDDIHDSSILDLASISNRTFHNNIPKGFADFILSEIVSKIGVNLDEDREYYHVQVVNKSRGTIITCKCTVIEALGELEIYKIELNQTRHLVIDISCLDTYLDLRMMLSSRRILTLNDDEKHSLNDIVKSAIIDSEVQGGLRWPLGKKHLNDRYKVIGTMRTKVKIFKNSSMKVKIRHGDRFDFRTSIGEISDEVSLRMTELNMQLREERLEQSSMNEMVQDTLKLVWEHFLCWED